MNEILLILAGGVLGALVTKLTELGVQAYADRRRDRTRLHLINYEHVVSWRWSGVYLLRRLIALDHECLGDMLTEEREGSAEQWAPIFMKHPETWTLLCAGSRKIVGYWHFVSLDSEHFARACNGELFDSEITIDTVAPMDVPANYNLYFSFLGIQPKYLGMGSILIDAFFARLESLAEKGIFFRQICANAYTKDGRRICQGFGMRFHRSHSDFGAVYILSLNQWPDRLRHKRWQNLQWLYERAVQQDSGA